MVSDGAIGTCPDRQPFTEDLRAEEGLGVLFFSPLKILRARELQNVKVAVKEQEALDKVSRAEA